MPWPASAEHMASRRNALHVQQGSTRELLMTLTDQLRADAVFMGAISRSGLKGLFLGNTAEDVLDRLHCDLVIVKPDGFTAALPLTTGQEGP